MSAQKEFHLEEYKSLRKQLELTLEEIATLARYSVFASAAVLSWLLSIKLPPVDPMLFRWAWWIPFAICSFAGFRVMALGLHIGQFARYIRQLEVAFQTQGWEYFLECQRKKNPIKAPSLTYVVFFVFLCLTTGFVGWYGFSNPARIALANEY